MPQLLLLCLLLLLLLPLLLLLRLCRLLLCMVLPCLPLALPSALQPVQLPTVLLHRPLVQLHRLPVLLHGLPVLHVLQLRVVRPVKLPSCPAAAALPGQRHWPATQHGGKTACGEGMFSILMLSLY